MCDLLLKHGKMHLYSLHCCKINLRHHVVHHVVRKNGLTVWRSACLHIILKRVRPFDNTFIKTIIH